MEINPAQWDQESRNSMDAYLDAVEAVLLEQKTPRSERILILGELESQIHSVIALRLGAGAELQPDLIRSVVESLDTPESYRIDAQHADAGSPVGSELESKNHASEAKESVSSAPVAGAPKERDPRFQAAHWLGKLSAYRQRSRIDEFAIVSCICALGAPLIAASTGRDREAGLVLAGLLLIVGCCLGWFSTYRIKRSDGKLWGGRWAFTGAMILPILLANIAAITLAVRTPLGILFLIAAVLFANYWVIRKAWAWIASQSLIPSAVSVPDQQVSQATGSTIPAV